MITVSKNNPSLFQTIHEALESCSDGETITIEPGVYRESILLDKDVEIIGMNESGQIIIESEDPTAMFVKANRVKFSNISFIGRGELNEQALHVDKGELFLSNCQFSSSGTGALLKNAETNVVFEKCTFHESKTGLEVNEGAQCQLTDCSIAMNQEIGIYTRSYANSNIRKSVIKNNGFGLLFTEGSQGRVEQCEITSNEKGIFIKEQAAPILDESMFARNKHNITLENKAIGIIYQSFLTGGQTGITVKDKSHLTIMESTIENSENYNISVETSTIHMKDCSLTNAKIGLYVKKSIDSTIEFATLTHHSNGAIILENENDVVVKNSKIDGAECGICFQQEATGEIQNCEITSSLLTGIAILSGSQPKITQCHVKDGQAVGLYLKDGIGTVKDCVVTNHGYRNLLEEGDNRTVLENCVFEEEAIQREKPVVGRRESATRKQDEAALNNILDELHSYVGLEEVKNRISDLMDFILYTNERKKAGIQTNETMRHHCIFLGKPGTGKTTVARLMSKIFYHLGVIEKDVFIEVDRKDLVGEYVGKTALKTNKVMKSAKGGVLFIDEAYTLVKPETKNDFGQEALDLILKKMEDDNSFVVIAAGYPEEMEGFLEANPGLKDRFTNHFYFEDFTPDQLLQIFEKMMEEEEYSVSSEGKQRILQRFTEFYRKRDKTFSNARMVRKWFEELKMAHAKRCVRLSENERTKEVLTAITNEEIEQLLQEKEHQITQIPVNEERLAILLRQLHSLIGLDKVKQEVEQMIKLVKYYKEEGKDYTGKFTPHTVFLGNPGTGKTTVARLLSQIYEALGVLPVGNLIEASREDLVAGFVGQTALKTTEVLNKSMGSTLFIDEAYTLTKHNSQNDYGQEAIETILKRMEDDRGKFHLIAAGYTNEMQAFLKSNPGLASRFGHVIHFEDYTPADMVRIAEKIAADEEFEMGEGVQESLLAYFENSYRNRDRYFSNARFVRTVVEMAIRQASLRMADLPKGYREGQNVILMDDFYQLI